VAVHIADPDGPSFAVYIAVAPAASVPEASRHDTLTPSTKNAVPNALGVGTVPIFVTLAEKVTA
jgi:hypothetical protein